MGKLPVQAKEPIANTKEIGLRGLNFFFIF